MEKNACKRIKDKMERLTQEVDERYRAERETPTRVRTHTHTWAAKPGCTMQGAS